MPDPKRDSRRSSRSGTSDAHRHEKRERSRSYQEARRGSSKPSEQERPRLKSRTHSAPLVQSRQQQQDHVEKSWDQDGESEDDESPLPSGSRSPAYFDTLTRTTSGDALSRMPSGPPVSPRSTEPNFHLPLPEINIVVLGAPGVGKSTFIQLALDLPTPASLGARKIPLNGSSCLVRSLELPFDEVDIDEDDIISWPDRIEQRKMPRVDGAMTLYDVSDRKSFEQVPEVLTAISKASIPSMLISSKCDYSPAKRHLDPVQIEETAKSRIGNIETSQTTFAGSDAHKRGVSVSLKAIQANKHDQVTETSAAHRRTKSSAYSKPPLRLQSQSRASADSVGMTPIDSVHTRHDSSMMTNSPKRSSEPIAPNEMHHSFLSDESTESDTEESAPKEPDARSETPSDERGYTFDNLVDRLLASPKSKADSRFGAIFSAEYRNFAAPGRLLEAIVCRFEALDSTDTPFMMKTVSQLRYSSVIEQWIGAYPGDFAHPTTLRRMRTFIVKIAGTRIFSAAANEMTFDSDAVHEDDDTNWAYSDRDCERRDTTDTTASWESRASTLLDDPDFTFPDRMGSLSSTNPPSNVSTIRSNYSGLSQVDSAQKHSKSLVPNPRIPLTKVQWRAFLDAPSDQIAKELTRIDWTMFAAIRPRDCLRHVTSRKEDKANCCSLVHMDRMIEHFNHLGYWVQNSISFRDKPKHRASMLEKFMSIARKSRESNNYNSLGAILAGVNNTAVHRLAATRDSVPQDVVKDWARLEISMAQSRSYSAYRSAWENSSGERIPYIPSSRRDLVGAMAGNKTFVGDEPDGRINWRKFEIEGDVIVMIQRAQGLPYRASVLGGRNEEIRSMILDSKLSKDEEFLYQRSTQIEATSGSGSRTGIREFFRR